MNGNHEDIEKDIQERFEKALNEDIPNIHFNGFLNRIGTGDILIVLERNNKPVAILNASYTVAKTLAQKLGNLIANLEDATGNTIMTTDDIGKKLSKKKDENVN